MEQSLPLMAALEKSSWNVQEVRDSFAKPNFFSELEAAFKNEFDLTKRMRLLVAFSLLPKDTRQNHASEIMKIIDIAKNDSIKKEGWINFLASFTEHNLKNAEENFEKVTPIINEQVHRIVNSATMDRRVDPSFIPRQYMYLQDSEVPTLIKQSLESEKNRHFTPLEVSNSIEKTASKTSPNASTGYDTAAKMVDNGIISKPSFDFNSSEVASTTTTSNPALKRKLVQKPQIQRYEVPLTDNKKLKSDPTNGSAAIGSTSTVTALQKHYCEQIKMYIDRADRAVLIPRRRKIIEDFMANPKDPRYKQRLCAVPLTKKLVEETEDFMKLELSLLIFNFKDGTWNFKDKKYKKIQRPPPSSVVAPVDMRGGDRRSNFAGTPSYYGMSPSPSASPPMRFSSPMHGGISPPY